MMKIKQRKKNKVYSPQHKILVPVSNIREAEILVPFANALSMGLNSQLIVMNIITVASTDRLSQEANTVSRSRQALFQFLVDHDYQIPEIQTAVKVTHEIWDGIWEAVENENADMLVLGWQCPTMPQTVPGKLNDPRLIAPPCDLVIVRPGNDLDTDINWEAISRILLPVRGGLESTLSLRVSQAIAEYAQNGQITLLHATTKSLQEYDLTELSHFNVAIRSLSELTRSLTVINTVKNAIIEEASFHQIVVMGAPSKPTIESWLNEDTIEIEKQIEAHLVVTKEAVPSPAEQNSGRERKTKRRDRPLAVVVDKWFAENTFHSREFSELEFLVSLKEKQNITISLGLPALNEEATVGSVISSIKKVLMDDFPILDEMILIDSGSTDYTREIAESMDIPVIIHQEVLNQYPHFTGKGEALWKSLYVLKGDLIAWIDTDIKNIHPRFVYGVIGPLLRDQRIKYVKGFYRRPLRQGDKLIAGGGGRVTELTARPLINLFFPELSGIIQPLSGEYAGRRTVLEQLPFFTGYGVETGLLLDILNHYGIHAIAQVDLLERIHHNQQLRSLSKMSFTIIQVFMSRLQTRHNIQLLEEANLTMNLPRYSPNRFYLETQALIENERPPIASIPEYRLKFGLPNEVFNEAGIDQKAPETGKLG